MEPMPEAATNITLSFEICEQAWALGIDVASTCEQALSEAIRAEQRRRWAVENADFIKAYNEFVEKNGLPLEEHRMF